MRLEGILVASWLAFVGSSAFAGEQLDTAAAEFFEKRVRPVLVEHCLECHSDKEPKGGLRLDSRDGWANGGDSGPAIVPGNPEQSPLILAVRYGGDYEMPPKGRLPDQAIRDLEEWVRSGAFDPRIGGSSGPAKPAIDIEAGKNFWSYRPVQEHRLPEVVDSVWARGPIDRFILQRLESSGLAASPEATRQVQIRRLYFDLIGLPPSPEEIAEFVQDPNRDAYERLVERLLASPHFGERWGRHWLDVARFAESITLRGFIFKEAWRYRDYVIDTFNGDRSYDDFLREQIAGDLLPTGTLEEQQRNLIATSYLVLGNTNLEEQDKKQLEMDVVDEQLDVIGKGILAQTITCARCHDHKFDPIPARDYYAMAGILKNVQTLEHANVSKWIEKPLPLEADQLAIYEKHAQAVAALKAQIKAMQAAVGATAAASADAEAIVPLADLPGVVVDDVQAKRVGEWKHSQFSKRYIGDGYLHDDNEGKGERTLTFAPELPSDGTYEVRLAYVHGASRAANVPVTVFSADGEKSISVNQKVPGEMEGRWVSLGQFRFERAGQSFVIVANTGTEGHVVADAVQFLQVDASAANPDNSKTKPLAPPLDVELKKLEQQLKQLTADAPYRPASMSVLEQSEIHDLHINVRGNVHQLGPKVERGFLQVCGSSTLTLPPDQSGRKELAEWIANPEHPLTVRVMVNRLWHWTMGVGIVPSVDNFGTTGDLPSHPELLDYLARRLADQDWSIKEVVREIVLSSTYRQSSLERAGDTASSNAQSIDPENRLLGRMNRKRLDAESLRDAMLAVSGALDFTAGGVGFRTDLAADYGYVHQGRRRSVYSPVFRNAPLEILEAFDVADSSVVTGRRNVSTVAPQALYLMNHPFVIEQVTLAAERLLSEDWESDERRLQVAFERALGRGPTEAEVAATLEYLKRLEHTLPEASSVDDRWARLVQSLFSSIDFRYLR